MVSNEKYSRFSALNPFFDIVMKGLDGLVDGYHFRDAVAEDAVFEFLYHIPGWPGKIESRRKYMKVMEGYSMRLQSADGLVVHRSQDQRTVILEYAVHGVSPTGKAYNNRFYSVIVIKDRKIIHWRDYMDSLAAMLASSST
jgi:ketosteroid isomerase-like protein